MHKYLVVPIDETVLEDGENAQKVIKTMQTSGTVSNSCSSPRCGRSVAVGFGCS